MIRFYKGELTESDINHEREAYANESDRNYLKNRKLFAMWRK